MVNVREGRVFCEREGRNFSLCLTTSTQSSSLPCSTPKVSSLDVPYQIVLTRLYKHKNLI